MEHNFLTSFSITPVFDNPFMSEVRGSIFLGDEEDKPTEEVGYLTAHILRLGQMLNADQIDDVLFWVDAAESQNIADIMTYVTAGAENPAIVSPSIISDLGEEVELCDAVFYIESAEIKPEYRKQGLGLRIVHDFIHNVCALTQSAIIICEPGPLNRCEEQFPGVKKSKAKKKLEQHWAKLGFVKLSGKSGYWGMKARDLIKLPELEEAAE